MSWKKGVNIPSPLNPINLSVPRFKALHYQEVIPEKFWQFHAQQIHIERQQRKGPFITAHICGDREHQPSGKRYLVTC